MRVMRVNIIDDKLWELKSSHYCYIKVWLLELIEELLVFNVCLIKIVKWIETV